MHHQFEDLCTLAITSQITNSEKALLDEHMQDCDRCRSFVQGLRPERIGKDVAPAIAELLAIQMDPPAGMRERFLQRAAAAGIPMNPGQEWSRNADSAPAQAMPEVVSHRSSISWLRSRFDSVSALVAQHPMLSLATSALCGGIVVVLTLLHRAPTPTAFPLPVVTLSQTVARPFSPVAGKEQTLDSIKEKAERERLSAQFKELTSQTQQLQTENQALRSSLMSEAQTQDALAAAANEKQAYAQALQDQLAAMRQQLGDTSAQMQSLRLTVSERDTQMKDAQKNLAAMRDEMDRLYAAHSSYDSLIASRNLHIVDVYDTNNKGGRQKAFGRVFFVEGKSLVFYAYDLPAPKGGKDFTFQLWGEGGGSEPVAYKLGLMRPDAGGQARWMVSCDNPKVLGQLQAVYIAPVSPRNKPPEQKMMYAYLGHPNHP